MTDVDARPTGVTLTAETFFRDHAQIVHGVERWQRALAGKKRDQADMRIILEGRLRETLTLLAELIQAEARNR